MNIADDAELSSAPTRLPERPTRSATAVPLSEQTDANLSADLVYRGLCVLSALGLLILAEGNFGVAVSSPWRAQISPLGFALALALAVAACVVRTPRSLNLVMLGILVVALGLTAFEAAAVQLAHPGFSTDEGAFVQYATKLLIKGWNPYTHSLAPGLQLYGPAPVATSLTNGSISTSYLYPSLPVLLTVPFYWITGGVQSVSVAAVSFQCVAAVVLYLILPRCVRPLAVIVVFELPLLFGFEMAGSFYSMLLPFALVAIWKWTETGKEGRLSRADIGRGICLGLACAVEQVVWPIALFLVLGVWRSRSRAFGNAGAARIASRFGLVALAAFGTVNIPFVIWSASAWGSGVISAFTQHSIPYGEGLIDLTLFLRAGGGNLGWYSDAAVLLFVALLIAYIVWFRILWRSAVVLGGLLFFISTRPLDGYWIEVAPLWMAAVLIPGAKPDPIPLFSRTPGRPVRIALAAALFAPALTFTGLALAATAPLKIRVESVQVESNLADVWQVTVGVTNLTQHAVRPHFALNSGGQLSAYWNIDSGPTVLGGGNSATYLLSSPNLSTDPSESTPFVMSAVVANPDSVSTSPVFQAVKWVISLSPSEVNHLIPIGHQLTFRAQLENSTNSSPIRVRGVKVALQQLVLGERHVTYGQASINGEKASKHAVIAETNSQGIATFRVKDSDLTGVNNHPIYFRAAIYSKKSFSYGASNAVSVKWYAP